MRKRSARCSASAHLSVGRRFPARRRSLAPPACRRSAPAASPAVTARARQQCATRGPPHLHHSVRHEELEDAAVQSGHCGGPGSASAAKHGRRACGRARPPCSCVARLVATAPILSSIPSFCRCRLARLVWARGRRVRGCDHRCLHGLGDRGTWRSATPRENVRSKATCSLSVLSEGSLVFSPSSTRATAACIHPGRACVPACVRCALPARLSSRRQRPSPP